MVAVGNSTLSAVVDTERAPPVESCIIVEVGVDHADGTSNEDFPKDGLVLVVWVDSC